MKHRTTFIFSLMLLMTVTSLFLVTAQTRYRSVAGVVRAAVTASGAAGAAGDARDVLIPARSAANAPALAAGTWINSGALTLGALRGRVVVVDFWTFGCYNCRNTLPALKRFDATYRDKGLTIVGVHTPESDYERDIANVRRAVRKYGVAYPVLTDNSYATWNAYGTGAWPTTVILDKQGRVRFRHVGEGYYGEMDEVIRKLLAE